MEIQREKNCTKRLARKDGTIFREFIENTTANGMARIFTKQYGILRRLFWLVVILVCSASCLYYCINRIIFLASCPTSTTIGITQVQPLEFPGVTVCNLNFFTSSSLEAAGLLEAGMNGLKTISKGSQDPTACKRFIGSNPVAK